jgi:hypothetical protein
MTTYPSPSDALRARRLQFLKLIGMVLSGLMVLSVLVVFVLIMRSESAHDEQRCPFARSEARALAGDVQVIEEARRCVPEAEERRWLVQRGSEAPIEIARKRLPRESFAGQRFAWRAREDAKHQVVVELEVDGKSISEFHESDAPGRAP